MSRLRTFYYSDGRSVRVTAAEYERKVRAQAAAAARHGLVRVQNARGRPQLLTPDRAVAYQARQVAARRAPRDAAGRLTAGVASTRPQVARILEGGRKGLGLDLSRPLPGPVALDGPTGLIAFRGDFSRWVGATLDEARILGVSPLQVLRVTVEIDGMFATRDFAFDPRPSTAPEDLRWPEQVYAWARGAAFWVARGGRLSAWAQEPDDDLGGGYGRRASRASPDLVLVPGDLPGGVGPVLAAGTGIEDATPPLPFEISCEFV